MREYPAPASSALGDRQELSRTAEAAATEAATADVPLAWSRNAGQLIWSATLPCHTGPRTARAG